MERRKHQQQSRTESEIKTRKERKKESEITIAWKKGVLGNGGIRGRIYHEHGWGVT